MGLGSKFKIHIVLRGSCVPCRANARQPAKGLACMNRAQAALHIFVVYSKCIFAGELEDVVDGDDEAVSAQGGDIEAVKGLRAMAGTSQERH